jgi:membrane-associated phospholipid phosphatase
VTLNPHKYFRITIAVCFAILLATIAFFFIYGKTGSFVIINGSYHPVLDKVFQFFTLLGDGMIYVPIVLYCVFYNRHYLIAVLSGIIICTIITQVMKHYVFPEDLRPFSLQAKRIFVHAVPDVPLHRLHSFPSGHTSTAFTMALLLAEVIKKRSWCFILPLIAMLVGYSRVYLAQHFVTDVLAGMTIGMISAYLAMLIYDAYRKNWQQRIN